MEINKVKCYPGSPSTVTRGKNLTLILKIGEKVGSESLSICGINFAPIQ
jgi:hypothetical protein